MTQPVALSLVPVPFRWLAMGMVLPATVALQGLAPSAGMAAARVCRGTLLQIQVTEQGATRSDRFRFSLGVDAEAPSKAAALQALNARLSNTRRSIQALAMGQLTIPSPRSYRVSGGSSGPRLERATTSVSGEVRREKYDALIQLAGRLPGVRLQGMTSVASAGSSASLADQLLDQALHQGHQRAESTARALGLHNVELLRMDQRGSVYQPMAMAAQRGQARFNPGEAPQPTQSLNLKLDYCLH